MLLLVPISFPRSAPRKARPDQSGTLTPCRSGMWRKLLLTPTRSVQRAGMKAPPAINPTTNAANPTIQHLSRNHLLLELVLQTRTSNTLKSASPVSTVQGAIHELLATTPDLNGNEERSPPSASNSSQLPSRIDVAPKANATPHTNVLCGIEAFIPIARRLQAANRMRSIGASRAKFSLRCRHKRRAY
jgi:hypothetical protein